MDRADRPEWGRLNDGEMPPGELQRIDDAVSRPVDEQGGGGAIAHPGMAGDLQGVWGRVTALYTAEGPGPALYHFEQIAHVGAEAVTVTDGVAGVAQEVNDNVAVPTDGTAICHFWPSEDAHEGGAAERWRFTYSNVNNYDGDVINYYDVVVNYFNSVLNFYDVTFNFNNVVINVTDVVIWQGDGYTIYDHPVKYFDGVWWHYHTITLSTSQAHNLSLRVPAATGKDRVVVRLSAETALGECEITGAAPIPDTGSGQVVVFENVTEDVYFILKHQDANSDEANRFACPDLVDYELAPGEGVVCWYDPASARWRPIGRAAVAEDVYVKVSANDTTTGHLSSKIQAGTGIGIAILNTGANEQLQISSTVQEVTWKYERYYLTTGVYYHAGHPTDVQTSSFLSVGGVGKLWAFPFVSARPAVTDAIGVTTGTSIPGASIRLGIYSNLADDDMRPDAKLYDSGDIDASTAGVLFASTGGVAFEANKLYWLVLTGDNVTIQVRAASSNQVWGLLGSTTPGGPQGVGWYATGSYGALPATWPGSHAPATYTPNSGNSVYMIGITFSSLGDP
jgi:hypothetical protein